MMVVEDQRSAVAPYSWEVGYRVAIVMSSSPMRRGADLRMSLVLFTGDRWIYGDEGLYENDSIIVVVVRSKKAL